MLQFKSSYIEIKGGKKKESFERTLIEESLAQH